MIIRWVALVAPLSGNSPVLTYNLFWNNGQGEINIELADSLITEYSLTGLTGGTFYKFQVRASNIYGYGERSDVSIIEASDVPDVMAIMSTRIEGTKFQFEWTSPIDNFDPVDEFELMIRKADGTFYRDTVNCPGTPVFITTCKIEMDTIRVATGLVQGDLVRGKIRARNINGWGAYSQVNFIGALIETRPLQMEQPTYDIQESTNFMIKLYWTPLIQGQQTGGIPLDGYRVFFKAEADSEWTLLDSPTEGFTYISSLVPGNFYTFKVIALNKYGEGVDSPTVRIVAG